MYKERYIYYAIIPVSTQDSIAKLSFHQKEIYQIALKFHMDLSSAITKLEFHFSISMQSYVQVKIEQISVGDTLYLRNAAGGMDEDVDIGTPCIAVCSEAGVLGMLGTSLSETLLAEAAGLTLEDDEDQKDYAEGNQRLQKLTTVTVAAVKPLSKMRKGSKNPTVEVTITLADSLLVNCLTQDAPVLDSYRSKLREKRAKSV